MSKNCNGVATDMPTDRNSRAYCEGRQAAADGALVGTNPHASDPDATNWANGHESWTADPAGFADRDCCAQKAGGGYTP